jgi:hypothetical protein
VHACLLSLPFSSNVLDTLYSRPAIFLASLYPPPPSFFTPSFLLLVIRLWLSSEVTWYMSYTSLTVVTLWLAGRTNPSHSADCGTFVAPVVLAMFRSGHLPDPLAIGLPGHPSSPAPANPSTDFTCTSWCHSDLAHPKCPILSAIFPGCTSSAPLPCLQPRASSRF